MRPTYALALAASGPLWTRLEASIPKAAFPVAEEWASHGEALAASLTNTPINETATLDPALATRVYHLYLPIYFFARERVRAHKAAGFTGAVTIGLSAPQGCGKTTLVDALLELFEADGLVPAAVSFDDFYLEGKQQDALAAEHSTNPLLQVRGNAGTHDMELGTETLRALTRREAAAIPRYDKAARSGRGDRAPKATWPRLKKPADIVLFEGWMNGFAPLPSDSAVLSQHAGLNGVNERLGDYEAKWHDKMDAWVVLGLEDVSSVYGWRLQAERAMAAQGRPGMSDAQVADFVSRYMPAYDAYLPGLYEAAEGEGVGGKPTLLVWVDKKRAPVVGRTRCINWKCQMSKMLGRASLPALRWGMVLGS